MPCGLHVVISEILAGAILGFRNVNCCFRTYPEPSFVIVKCTCMDDPDKAIFPYLIEEVPIGTDVLILPSNCFPKQDPPEDYQPPLLTEVSPDIVQELIDKEVTAGCVKQLHGTLEEAQSFFDSGLALSDSRPPRLVLDSTVCGVNPPCIMPERATLPTIRDVVRSYPIAWRTL